MAFEGADPDQLDTLGSVISGAAGELGNVRVSLTARVHRTSWRGSAAERFVQDWDHTLAPLLAAVAQSLDGAASSAHENATQQRTASGQGPSAGGNTITGFFHRVEKDVDAVGKEEVHLIRSGAEDVVHGVKEVGAEDLAEARMVVSSQAFAETLGILNVVASAAGVLAVVPGLGEVAAVVAVSAGGLALLGHVAQMANSGDWDMGELAEEGADVGLDAVGAGAFGDAAKGAGDLDLVAQGSDDWSSLSTAQQAVTAVRGVRAGIDVGTTTESVTTDVVQGDYGKAATDAMGYASVPLDLGGNDDTSAEINLAQTGVTALQSAPNGAAATLEELGQ